ncbi:amidohydrolase [Pseudohongiella acticola]|uniref:Amidohydrolase n=1 Tax=Pseudohongiella acticola TaxID=1524254 RepID=A0A1E8CJ03_9GAMM|nr:amidohydrolase [Pseudohongiella acticola]OFE12394.1 amidohydrolase [Pseudohongiella acticola]
MNKLAFAASLLSCASLLVACSDNSPPTSAIVASSDEQCDAADLVLHNTTVYTANDAQWTADAVASKDGRIVFVGSNTDARRYMCGSANVIDMAGNTVYAGFTDSHQHLEGIGRRTKTLSLFGIATLQETVQTIENWADTIPEGEWVLGRGWIEREWTDQQRFLDKSDVDAFTANKPLYMPRADGVSALVNSRALELAGVTRDTPDPEGGRFERDLDGNPTGYVLANAMNVFRDILPPETDAYLKDNLLRGLQANAALGWTQTQDAGMSYRLVDLLQEIHAEGDMAHRVYAAIPIAEASEMLSRGRQTTADDLFDVRGIKVFIDGTLGSRGAALINNYSDADHNGFMNRTTKEELVPVLHAALRQGIQIETHVIGDRAVRTLLDWYDEAYNAVPRNEWASEDLRWRMEHAQIIPPSDQQRFVELGVLPSMQPSHGIGDLNFAPDRLGADRLGYAYPWQQLVDQGLMILGGSDAPVEAGDPRIEFYAAITRKRLDGTDGPGWHPELAVSRATALKMFTLWPAHGAFQEDIRGSIEIGKYADFTVFDRDLMTVEPQAILTAQPVMTVVGGQITYQNRQ